MRHSSTVLFTLTMLLTTPPCLLAQESVQVPSGARVRLTASALPSAEQVGRIISTNNDTIVFRADRNLTTRSLALSEITAVDVSLGQRRQTLRGAAIGLLAGTGVGVVLGLVSYEPCSGWCFLTPSSRSQSALWLGVVGGTLGLVGGTTIGFLNKVDRWQRLQPNTRLKVEPTIGNGGVAISYAF